MTELCTYICNARSNFGNPDVGTYHHSKVYMMKILPSKFIARVAMVRGTGSESAPGKVTLGQHQSCLSIKPLAISLVTSLLTCDTE